MKLSPWVGGQLDWLARKQGSALECGVGRRFGFGQCNQSGDQRRTPKRDFQPGFFRKDQSYATTTKQTASPINQAALNRSADREMACGPAPPHGPVGQQRLRTGGR